MTPPPTAPANSTKPITLILWLVFFFPVGLWLLWRDPHQPLMLKRYATGIIAALLLWSAVYPSTPAGRADQARTDRDAAAAQLQENKEQKKQAANQAAAKAAQAKAEAHEEAASQRERDQQDKITERSLARMRHDFLSGTNAQLVSAVETGDDPYEVRITVKNEWFLRLRQIRLQSAQNLWGEWAELRSPGNPGRAYIDIVDVNGNHVGGSDVTDGANVKVDE